jgi:hypothetical protein
MPTRRTSPRRTATRPIGPLSAFARSERDDEGPPSSRLVQAAPWLAITAAVIAVAALAVTVLGGGTDMNACRKAAWAASPDQSDLPTGWTLSSTDLNANGMTVSILGQASADGTSQPAVYASVTCYGDVAQTAMSQYRTAAKAAAAKVTDRGMGGDAYDVSNTATGSVTTLFRVGGLIGQIADAGSAGAADLDQITVAVATAMGDENAAGARSSAANPSDDTGASPDVSEEPLGSGDAGASEPPTAPELEAHLPTDVGGTPLTIQSGGATDYLPQDPSSGALVAALRRDGIAASDLQVAQAYDATQALDLNVIGFRLTKGDVTKLRTAVINSWLSGTGPGVKQTTVKLAAKAFTKIDYGTGRIDYVYAGTDYVVVVETSDAALATEVAAGLK